MEQFPIRDTPLPPFLHNSQAQIPQTPFLNNHSYTQFSRRKPANGPREKADEERQERESARFQLEGRGRDEADKKAEETLRLVDGRAEFGYSR